MSTTSSGEREPNLPLSIRHPLFQSIPVALSSLTVHSAEVNIGIIAACLPTLLPLYRLVRDKIRSTTGRFHVDDGKFLFGQRPNADISSQQAPQGPPHADSEATLPQNAQRVYSGHRPFTTFGEAEEDKDTEMQTSFSGRPGHFQYF